MTIQWFPGHMAKAIREMKEKRGQIDVVIEVLDARIPNASRNPLVAEIFPSHPRLLILTKSDLADRKVTQDWIEHFTKDKQIAIALDVLHGHHGRKIEKTCQKLLPEKALINAIILGIPNVGKSTLINHLAGKNKVVTGYHPGVTKKQQWMQVGKGLRLMDTPGILWPKFEDPLVGKALAVTHAIKDERFDLPTVIYYLCEGLSPKYDGLLKARFNLDTVPEKPEDLLTLIGKKRGCVISGGEIDYDRVYQLFLHEFRRGLIGKISLEIPK